MPANMPGSVRVGGPPRLPSSGATLAGFPTDQWTLQRVQIVVVREFGIQYSLSNVSSLLKSLGLGTDRSSEDRAVLRLEVPELPLRKGPDGRPVEPLYQLGDHLPDALMRYDFRHGNAYVNSNWAGVVGVPVDALLGRQPGATDPVTGESERSAAQRVLQQLIRRVLVSHQAEYVDLRSSLPSGRVADLHVRVLPEFDADGQCAAVLAVVRNESTPAELRRRLDQCEAWLDVLQRDGGMGYVAFDEHGALESISSGACMLLGHTLTWRPSLEAWIVSFHAEGRDALADAVAQLTARRKQRLTVDVKGSHSQPAQAMRVVLQIESRGRSHPRRVSATLRALEPA